MLLRKSKISQKAINYISLVFENILVHFLSARALNLLQCKHESLWTDWFVSSESTIDSQWEEYIWPLISNFDFAQVLELSPGGGRNTVRLCEVANSIVAVDYNAYALDKCRAKLGNEYLGCVLDYRKNNGFDLRMIPTNSVTAIYCWDSVVHFEKSVLDSYIREFSRILAVGGRGFLNHSTLGNAAQNNIKNNLGWRSNVSKVFAAQSCKSAGLAILNHIDIPRRKTNSSEIHFFDAALVFEKTKIIRFLVIDSIYN